MEIREYTDYREDEILRLYSAAGWTAYTDNAPALREGFRHSLLTLAAYEGEALLSLARVVGDGATIVLIQDILVDPACRRRGLGTALLKAVLARYADVRQIQLTTDRRPETMAFYQSLGFTELSQLGCCGFMRC